MVKKRQYEESSSEEEEKYHVEVIEGARVNDDGDWDYLVKWAGYDSDANSWEPSENVAGCERLLKSFWRHVGDDNEDYPVGYETFATEDWIEKEKKYFVNNFGVEKDEKQKKKKADTGQKKPVIGKAIKSKSGRGLKKPIIVSSESETDEVDNALLPLLLKKRPRQRYSDSDSDKPLRKAPRSSKTGNEPSASVVSKNKGKAPAKPRRVSPPPPPTIPGSDGLDSLFSAPSSPAKPPNGLSRQSHQPGPSTLTKKPDARLDSQSAAKSVAIAGPKPPAPSHKDRVPKIKMMDVPVRDTGGTIAISTKARIAQQAKSIKPTNPVLSDPTAMLKEQQKAALQGLSFKKKPSITNSNSRNPFEDNWATSPLDDPGFKNTAGDWGNSGSSGWGQPEDRFVANTLLSPVSMQPPAPIGDRPAPSRAPPQAMSRRQSLVEPRQSPVQPTRPATNHVDQFLASILPAELAAPMEEYHVEEDTPNRPARIAPNKPPLDIIPKNWKWAGEAYTSSKPGGKTDRLCNVSLSEPTNPRPNGLRLSICYNTEDSILQLQKLHDVSDLFLILRACAFTQQFCKFGPLDVSDVKPIGIFSSYMARMRQFTYARVHLDGDPVGLLLIFPSVMKDICDFFKVPPNLVESSQIIAALIPWTLTVDEYRQNRWMRNNNDSPFTDARLDPELAKHLQKDRKLLAYNNTFSLGLRILRFTASVYKFLERSPRSYCIWHSPADGSTSHPGFETKLLLAILDVCKAKNVGYKTDVRVIFVHVGALPTFHKLEALGMRRCKQSDLRIYSYGTHQDVQPDRWSLREIYPLGGIVTFTPKAIIENPFEVYKVIAQIDRHPLWMCYINPCVVAAVAKLSYPDHDPLAIMKQGEFFYEGILQLIEDGKISLLSAPPNIRQLGKSYVDKRDSVTMDWVCWLISLVSLDTVGILAECLKLFNKRFGQTDHKDLTPAVEKEILHDMCQLQIQPVLMDNYRRFVTITETRNEQLVDKDGVEYVTLSKFDFKDDYFRGMQP
ncbi:hypothetical protein EW026_g379 [Hermanssonia centrifuga]|uniref:Chromo domain-containing protein n=1 Tax=Hermanssonia centrifuga TaxID=98765 RepID=A0A4S4KZG3_9APHY|nr:hypothetical protein EW026_g379 [Hermanssonia centrifuga]